jgi:beta-ureidopropionase / N-carbamoyl-L-amino-acid hydrolase
MRLDEVRINQDRLWQDLMDMAKIGATPKGGVARIALTDLDRQARDLFVGWCRAAGCALRVDRIGNVFARRAGLDADRPPVMTGSHLDTQPLGGKFDGIYGVLAGLEVIRTLNDARIDTLAPIEVVVWTDEEGARFGGGTIGSGAFAGRYDVETGLGRKDNDGITVGEALAAIGYAGDAPVGGYPVEAFFEVHIEQGPILERDGVPIGVVLGAQGGRNFRVTVDGEEGHAGTLPMELRHDALLGAARMIDALNAVAFRHEPHPVITVGQIHARPNSRNTIPGQVVFSIDSRHPDNRTLDAVERDMRAACEEIARKTGLAVAVEPVSRRDSIAFDRDCARAVARAADTLDLPWQEIYSGAGHDACNLALIAPTGMIFVPCEDGVSHNERENARPEHVAAGCDVLLQAMAERAEAA